MMMLIIFLITDISMVGIFAGVYGNIAKYREGMLMGVHIPKSELEHPPVLQIKTTDTTIFLNSSNEAQTKEWYNQLNDAISSNK